jgi:hypothetical protein
VTECDSLIGGIVKLNQCHTYLKLYLDIIYIMFNSIKEVYLCVSVKENKNNKFLNKFTCKKFDTYEEADKYYKERYDVVNVSTMLTMCKFTPTCLKEQILNYKLSKIFTQSKIE